MSNRPIEIDGLTVVVIGVFNPAIFHPSWFAANNLVRKEEADEAKVEFVTPDATAISTSWFKLQVLQHRLTLHTSDPTKHPPLRDLAVGTFTVLEHTPVQTFGLNRERHVRMANEAEWHRFGHFFAPKAPWDGVLTNPGMRSLVMQGGYGKYGPDAVRVKVEPSTQVTPYGLYVSVHQHCPVVAEDTSSAAVGSAARFCSSIGSVWSDFLSFSDCVEPNLLRRFDESKG